MTFFMLLLLNSLAECLLNRMLLTMKVLEKKNSIYQVVCAIPRIIWIYLCAWLSWPIPVLLTGLLALLFLSTVPYRRRKLLMHNFIMIIFLIFTSLLMMGVGFWGLLGIDVAQMTEDITIRVGVLNVTFLLFNVICALLLRFYPEFLWKENDDRFKVVSYTRFLLACSIYHIFDVVILTWYDAGWVNYLLLVLGDILIVILMFNFFNYNYVFAKSEEMKTEYVENEILLAQQYFEKEELKRLSEFDFLTNVYNRREISSLMLSSIQSGKKLVCVFIDLDGLKRVNDKYGHTNGDLMLKRFADAGAKVMEENGYFARIGGDEFLMIFLDWEIDAVEKCMKELQLQLLEPAEEKEKIYFSYGISYNEKSVDDYIKTADQRMYACKKRKRRGAI